MRSARLSGLRLRDQVGAAGDDAGLGPAQQFVATERNQIGAGSASCTVGSCGRPKPPAAQAAQVHHQRQAMFVRDRSHCRSVDLAVNPVIA